MKKATLDILLIEDNPAEAGIIKEMLSQVKGQQYSVEHVQYLEQGLDLLRDRSFDVIILDLGLPDSQGLDTISALRNQDKHTPAIVMTVLDDEELALKSLEMDIQDYLIKDEITSPILKRTVRYAIQRKRAAEELRRSEMKFATIFRAAPVLLVVSRPIGGEIIDVNEAMLMTCGYQREEVLGRSDRELCIWDNHSEREDVVRALLEQGPVRDLEINFRDKAGKMIVGLMSAELIEIGGEEYMLSLVKDITERKRDEEALREAENRYRTLFNTIDEGFCIVEMIFDGNEKPIDYRFLEINPAFEKHTGLKESLGKKMRELAPQHEDHWFETYGKIALTGQPARFENIADSLNRWYDVYAFRFGQAEKLQVAILFNDITERKLAEENTARLNAELAVRASDLESSNAELATFNRMVSHDLRLPLNQISVACQAVAMLSEDKLDQESIGLLKMANDGVKNMRNLIDTLLRFSSSSHSELRRKLFDIGSIAKIVTANLRLAEPERKVEFRIGEKLAAFGAPELLQVVLENLLGNAWKYTGDKSLAVIEFGSMEIEGNTAFFVRDNGPGFHMVEADKLFQPFKRLAETERYSGHGIGLATVEKIVQRHGGKVWAEGDPGKGATFYFMLGI